MHYKCKKCNYEFDVFITPHPHQGLSFLQVGGCPTCAKANAMSKVCPKCGSLDLEQSIENKK
jgi:hypothetical protein